MGKRTNQPALGSWFVPGGRIKKGEDLDNALSHIGEAELGVKINRKDGNLVGIFDHLYETNFANEKGIYTQYVVIAYEYNLNLDLKKLPRDQHSEWRWVSEDQAGETHENSAAYFSAVQSVDDVAYSALNSRRDAFNNMLWQTPVLSLVAQAFLFTIILSAGTNPGARIIASLLALVTSISSLQLLAKHRYGECSLAIELDNIEKATMRYNMNQRHKSENLFVGLSSYRIWLVVLSLFGIAALITLIFPCLTSI